MQLLAPRLNNRNLIFFGSHVTALASDKAAAGKINPGKSTAVRRSCVPPPFYRHLLITRMHTHTHTHTCVYMHSPPHPRSIALNRQPDKRVCDQLRNSGCGSGWLLAGAGLLPLWLSCVYGVCAFVLRCFSCSHTVLPKEHSLGVIFFCSPSSCYAVFFFPCLLTFHYWLYPVWLCMWRIIKNLGKKEIGQSSSHPIEVNVKFIVINMRNDCLE